MKLTLSRFLLIVAVVLLVLLGCAGMGWLIHDHKSVLIALAGFASACWVASSLVP